MSLDSWSVDYMRLSCIDTPTHTLYFTGKTFSTQAGMTFNNLGPIGHHRFDDNKTNDTILQAGRTNPVIKVPTVIDTFAAYSHTEY